MTCPVRYADPGSSRKRTSGATSPGVPRRLDPDFRLGEALPPYAERLSLERLRLAAIAKRVTRASLEAGELALDLPGIMRCLAETADTAGIQVHLRAAELEPLVARTERIGNRLVAGMIGAALITGVGGIVAGERRWRSWEGGLLGAGLATIGSLGAYLAWTARHRRNYPRD